MATATLTEIGDMTSLLERVRNDGQVIIDAEGESFTVTRRKSVRPLGEVLADPSIKWLSIPPMRGLRTTSTGLSLSGKPIRTLTHGNGS